MYEIIRTPPITAGEFFCTFRTVDNLQVIVSGQRVTFARTQGFAPVSSIFYEKRGKSVHAVIAPTQPTRADIVCEKRGSLLGSVL